MAENSPVNMFMVHPNSCLDVVQNKVQMCFVLHSLLHLVAAGHGEQEVESGKELGLAARCLTCIADVLVGMAGGKGGLRSGPAANKAWSSAYLLLEKDLSGGVQALAAQRENWLSRWAARYCNICINGSPQSFWWYCPYSDAVNNSYKPGMFFTNVC